MLGSNLAIGGLVQAAWCRQRQTQNTQLNGATVAQ